MSENKEVSIGAKVDSSASTSSPPIEFRSAWKRRAFLVLIGALLLAVAEWQFWGVCHRPYQPPLNDSLYYEPLYLGLIKSTARENDHAAIKSLGDRKDGLLLLMRNWPEGGFRALYRDSAYRPDDEKSPVIPEAFLDFDPTSVLRAYQNTDLDRIRINDFAEGFKLRALSVPPISEILFLQTNAECFLLGTYYSKLTLYGQRGGRFESYFASQRPVVQWGFCDTTSTAFLVVIYSDGVGTYRWDGSFFKPGKPEDTDEKRLTRYVCRYGRRFGHATMWLVPSATVFWLWRLLKFLWLRITKRPYRRNRILRIFAIGCLAWVVVAAWGLMWFGLGASYYFEYYGPFASSFILRSTGWMLIAIAAIIPNRVAVPAAVLQPLTRSTEKGLDDRLGARNETSG